MFNSKFQTENHKKRKAKKSESLILKRNINQDSESEFKEIKFCYSNLKIDNQDNINCIELKELRLSIIEEKQLEISLFELSYFVLDLQQTSSHLKTYSSNTSLIKEQLQEPIVSQLSEISKSVSRSINIWANRLSTSTQNLIDCYHACLNKTEADIPENNLNLNENELELLKIISNFDIDSLDLYKNLSIEEEYLLGLEKNYKNNTSLIDKKENLIFSKIGDNSSRYSPIELNSGKLAITEKSLKYKWK